MSLWHCSHFRNSSRGKNALKVLYCQKAIAFLDSELALLEKVFSFPERFSEQQIFKSNLYIIPKSKGLGIIDFVELVVALFLLGGIYTTDGKKASSIQIANVFEQMFNFHFGDIYKKQVKLFDRKEYNLTKLLDSLRNLLAKENLRRNNEK